MFACRHRADQRAYVVPLIEVKVATLLSGREIVTVLIRGSEVAEGGAVAEDQIQGDTGTIGPGDS